VNARADVRTFGFPVAFEKIREVDTLQTLIKKRTNEAFIKLNKEDNETRIRRKVREMHKTFNDKKYRDCDKVEEVSSEVDLRFMDIVNRIENNDVTILSVNFSLNKGQRDAEIEALIESLPINTSVKTIGILCI
jgi:hypothetical protein